MVFKILSQTSRVLATLIGLALVGYIGYLVLAQYRTQLAVQDAALKQLTSDTSRRATALSYFFGEQKDGLHELGESREVSAYFENQALGMSLEYGLRASQIMIDELFLKKRSSKRLGGSPIFERIVFVEESGALLADTAHRSGATQGSWQRYLGSAKPTSRMTLELKGGEAKLVLSEPVSFKGRYAGEVVGWISAAQVYQYFIEASAETSRFPVALVFGQDYLNLPARLRTLLGPRELSLPPDIRPLVPYRLPPAPGETASLGHAILVPVQGTALSLITVVPGAEMFDARAPRRMLYTTGGIALFILFGMFYLQRMNTRTAVLQVHLAETTLREAAVDERNRLLASEIEERRQFEEALRESEARFRAMVGAVPVVIYEYRKSDRGEGFSFVGDKIYQLAGVAAEELTADTARFVELVHPEDRAGSLCTGDFTVDACGPFSREFRILRPDGETRWILATSLPQPGAAPGDLVWTGCLEDITDRKQADLALRESGQQLLDIINFLPDATLVIDKEGRVLAWNRAIEAMTGVKAHEIIGKGDFEYALPFYGERRPILIDLALNPACRDRKEYAVLHREADTTFGEAYTGSLPSRNGRAPFLSATASVLRDSQGEVIAAIECIRDSTERLWAEQLLRESEATLRTLMDNMPAGVWWYNGAGVVEYLNGRFAELFGYGMDELATVDEWYEKAYPDAEQRRFQRESRQALIAEARRSTGTVPPLETLVTCRDGNLRHVIVNTQLSQGRTLEILTDITEQEFIHNELLKVQKMESLGVLAGGIAHDFNNILTGIMGNISFAQMVLKEESEARLPLQAAEKASLRAAELAHQLLTFAKGGQPLKKVVSLRNLVAESVSLALRGTSVQARISLAMDLRHIEADAGQMNQAFNNIVINAVHAMSGGGTLAVSGENVLLEPGNRLSLPPGPYVKLQFQDDGCGIRQADLKNIFDPYFTTKSGGNGLGLASTLSIVRKHGGHIMVNSELGVGTSFDLFLPATEERAPEHEPLREAVRGEPAGGCVLVMDDEEMVRVLAAQILNYLGYQVTTCTDGAQAIAQYREAREQGAPFLAVIMDLTIPGGMGGKEAAQHILAYDPTARLVVSSGYSNDLALSDYTDFGFCGAVRKPYKVSELAETLAGLRPSA
ncbi:hypothetical protein GMST_37720 [Geomonas silvestris]|uniref:histidine kinase n=1 Tax=Geomonas silvestris TaxID=2740184 RepID=A0A6V8MNK1_9BACT|nr:PAS domain S-box protein [Geomonas silvestris]GFO61447.1 hypothetical protein GMST_37720 [Geomonas silvestris]